MRNMSKKTRKLIDRKVVHKYFWFDYLEGSIFYHSNHVWPARLWIGDAIDHNDDTQCWMYVPAHKEYDAAGNRIWDGVWGWGSYGFEQGLIEVMGSQLLGHDDVKGWLTARQITKMWRCRNAAQNR